MHWKRQINSASLIAMISIPLYASDIYHWIDESGVHHYEQVAPSDVLLPVSTVEIHDDLPSDFDPEADIFNVVEQAERMQDLRTNLASQQKAVASKPAEAVISSDPYRQKSNSRGRSSGWKVRGPKHYYRNSYWDRDRDEYEKNGRRKKEPSRTHTLAPPGRKKSGRE